MVRAHQSMLVPGFPSQVVSLSLSPTREVTARRIKSEAAPEKCPGKFPIARTMTTSRRYRGWGSLPSWSAAGRYPVTAAIPPKVSARHPASPVPPSPASLGRSRPLFATAIRADLPFSGSVQVRCASRWLAAGFLGAPMVNLWLGSI